MSPSGQKRRAGLALLGKDLPLDGPHGQVIGLLCHGPGVKQQSGGEHAAQEEDGGGSAPSQKPSFHSDRPPMQNPFYFKSNGEFSSRQALELTKFTPFGTTFAFPIEKVKIFIIVVGVRLCAPRRTAENTGHTEKICRG